MARTALFGLLQRAGRIARLSNLSGQPLDEVQESVQASRIDVSRRRLLIAGGSAATAIALAACVPRATRRMARSGDEQSGGEVVIVGAGIAGLTAAWRLHQAGVRVRIIEAQNRVGGRMFSLRGYFPDAQVVELGGELIDSGHVRIRALAAEMGLLLDDLQEPNPPIKSELWWTDGRAVSEAEIINAFKPVAAAIQRDLATLGDGDITYSAPQNAQALDALTVSQWLDRNGVSGWLRKLIEVAYTTEMGLECDQQSALNLLTFIGTKQDEFRIFGESD